MRDILQSSQRKFVPLVLDQIIYLKVVQTWCLAVVNMTLELESKLETRAFPQIWSERDMAPKLFCDLLGDHKTKPDSINIHMLVVLHETKKLEELIVIFLKDPNPGVNDLYFQKLI